MTPRKSDRSPQDDERISEARHQEREEEQLGDESSRRAFTAGGLLNRDLPGKLLCQAVSDQAPSRGLYSK